MSMISPETYYEMSLKGKTKEEILTEIRSLRREINRCIRSLEDPDYEGTIICPSDDVIIKCDWEYLERAKQAYAEAGGTYQPTRKEKRLKEFNQALDDLLCLELSYGPVLSKPKSIHCTVQDGTVAITYDPAKAEKNEWKKTEFIQQLKDLHIGEWKHNYERQSTMYHILDGDVWTLKITFASGRTEKFQGTNAYPWNFHDLYDLLSFDY